MYGGCVRTAGGDRAGESVCVAPPPPKLGIVKTLLMLSMILGPMVFQAFTNPS
jgi:hypothetical protein